MEIDYDGGDLIIAFNAKYIIEIMSILNAPKVEMALNEALHLDFKEHENDDYLFVIMLMRL